MLVRIVLWSLADSETSIGELRRHVRDEAGGAFAGVEGLRLKLWLSDEASERWGAVYLWDSREAAEQELPSRTRELIGRPPDLVEEFDLEASIEGRSTVETLSGLGLAFER